MDNTEPSDKESPAWKSWALRQAPSGGRPQYAMTPEGEIVEYASIEMGLLARRLFGQEEDR